MSPLRDVWGRQLCLWKFDIVLLTYFSQYFAWLHLARLNVSAFLHISCLLVAYCALLCCLLQPQLCLQRRHPRLLTKLDLGNFLQTLSLWAQEFLLERNAFVTAGMHSL